MVVAVGTIIIAKKVAIAAHIADSSNQRSDPVTRTRQAATGQRRPATTAAGRTDRTGPEGDSFRLGSFLFI